MDYAEAHAAFFSPRDADAPPPGTDAWDLPGRALRDALEPLATIHYWSEPASVAGTATYVAELWSQPLDHVVERLASNFTALFGIPP